VESYFHFLLYLGNIHVYDSSVAYSTGLAIGSVPPNADNNCVRGVTFRNITMYRPLKALYIKSNPGTSGIGTIEDIFFEDIFVEQALWWTVWIGKQGHFFTTFICERN
jgi:polygalacturonase